MGFGEALRRAMYLEPVLVWAGGLYLCGISYAFTKPYIKDFMEPAAPPRGPPPDLKTVMAGIHNKLNDRMGNKLEQL